MSSKWSKLESNNEKWKSSGTDFSAQDSGFGSYPPITNPPTSSLKYINLSGSLKVGKFDSTPSIFSVTKYWCWKETKGTFTPTVSANCLVHWPQQETIFSHLIRPLSVSNPLITPSSKIILIAFVSSIIFAPFFLAPFARAWDISVGFAWPSVGRKAAP